MKNTMILEELSFNKCEPIKMYEIGGSLTLPRLYNDLIEITKSSVILPEDLKLPNDFDESKDLPYGISDKVDDILFDDKNFILEIIKTYRDYTKDNKHRKYYQTSHGTICITNDYGNKPILCFCEDLENIRTLKVDFDSGECKIL